MIELPRLMPIPRAAIGAALGVLDRCSREEALAELEHEDKTREIRRIEREEGRGRSNDRRLRCGGCRRWLIAVNEHCGNCGFHNDIRGRRNTGGYH